MINRKTVTAEHEVMTHKIRRADKDLRNLIAYIVTHDHGSVRLLTDHVQEIIDRLHGIRPTEYGPSRRWQHVQDA